MVYGKYSLYVFTIDAIAVVSTTGRPEGTSVALANWNSRESCEDVSNPFESDLNNRIDGQNREPWTVMGSRRKKAHPRWKARERLSNCK